MHTVELLDQALAVAQRLGYLVRQEWLGGTGGGSCRIGKSKVLFLDLAETTAEQFDHVIDALRQEPDLSGVSMPVALKRLVSVRKAA